jgi:hypothetical protein
VTVDRGKSPPTSLKHLIEQNESRTGRFKILDLWERAAPPWRRGLLENTPASPVSPAPPPPGIFASLDVFASLVTPFASGMPDMWVRQRCKVSQLYKVAGSAPSGPVLTGLLWHDGRVIIRRCATEPGHWPMSNYCVGP